MYTLIREWEATGQTQSGFIEQHGISKSTFGYWRKKYLKENKKSTLIPVEVSPPSKSFPGKNDVIEIIYPNGVRVLCPVETRLADIRNLIN